MYWSRQRRAVMKHRSQEFTVIGIRCYDFRVMIADAKSRPLQLDFRKPWCFAIYLDTDDLKLVRLQLTGAA